MKRAPLFSLLFLCALHISIRAESPLAEASQAIDEHVPEVAILKLQNFLAQKISPAERAAASRELARALLPEGRADEALPILNDAGDEERLLKAEALSSLGRWSEAEPIFLALTSSDGPFFKSAKLGLAEILHALGRPGPAARELETLDQKTPDAAVKLRLTEWLLDAKNLRRAGPLLAQIQPRTEFETKWKNCLEARALLDQDQAAPALEKFEAVTRDPHGVTESLFVSAIIGVTEARIVLNGRESGDDVIENFIGRYSQSRYLEEMFTRLDEIYAKEESPSESELQKWAQKPPRRRAALAQFYWAKAQMRAGKKEKALRTLADFVRENPGHPFLAKAYAMQAELLLPEKPAPAVTAFEAAIRNSRDDETRAQMEVGAGRAHFHQREFLLAANLFHDAAAHAPKWWAEATYDAALAWLHLGNYDKFFESYKALSERAPESNFRRDLLLEEGLLQARSGDSRARASLELFLRDFPEHPRGTEARIALAEIAFQAADTADAANWLRVANESAAGESTDRGDYLAIFVADAAPDRNDDHVIALCETFLRQHERSQLLPEVRMKLGQIYFRREDFANAQTQFETLASTATGAPLAEAALFLAGQCAMHSMSSTGLDRALELFEQVAKLNGPLKLYARQEQALAEIRLGKDSEAVVLYDAILSANPPAALRFAALCGKADSLASRKDFQTGRDSVVIDCYDQIAADPEVTSFWRNQALYKKAKFIERQSDQDRTLTAFYDVLQPRYGAEPEFFWFFKAGFDAARLLENAEKWQGAIGIYDKLAKTDGPRAAEARSRANQLRLEHFIWE